MDSGDDDNKDDGDVDDDGDIDSNIDNDANSGNSKSKIECSEDTAGDGSNINADGGLNNVCDTNDDVLGQDDSDGESNDGADGHKNNDDDDDGGCLNSVKNCFRNKQVDLENLSLPISAR